MSTCPQCGKAWAFHGTVCDPNQVGIVVPPLTFNPAEHLLDIQGMLSAKDAEIAALRAENERLNKLTEDQATVILALKADNRNRYLLQDKVDDLVRDGDGLRAEVELHIRYEELLNAEIKSMIGIAASHGWQSMLVEEGIELRKKIAALRTTANEQQDESKEKK